MNSTQNILPYFEMDAEGQVQMRWPRQGGALNASLSLDEALDLQFQLATFLAQAELREWEAQTTEITEMVDECENCSQTVANLGQLSKKHSYLN
ncbi:MAG: hypothetical protein JST80_03780 [Bdellovibrionales bacterium]|nr:hypothetical protein [Bdellovibrionales bacterium]